MEAEVSSATTNTNPNAAALEQKVQEARILAATDPHQALVQAQEIREQAQLIDYKEGIAGSWRVAGVAHLQLARYTQALQAFQTSLELYQQQHNMQYESFAMSGMASVYVRLAIYDSALDYYLKALNLSRNVGDQLAISIQLYNIGELYLTLEHYDEALDYLRQTQEVINQALADNTDSTNELRLNSTLAATLGGIGEVYVAQNQPQTALEYLKQAEQVASDTNVLYHLSLIHLRTGRAYHQLQQDKVSLEYLQQAFKLAEISNKPLLPEILLATGQLYIDADDFATAIQYYQQALRFATEINARQQVYEAHHTLSKLYERSGDLAQALYHHQLFAQVKEEVGGAKTQQALAATQTRFEVAQAEQEREIYRLRNGELAAANAQIAQLNDQLKSENLRMGAELEITERLQQMVLPGEEELTRVQYLEIAPFVLPAEEVGGDYYDVLIEEMSKTGHLKIGIGDVTGHGLESGVIMLMVQTAIRTLLNLQITDPVQFLTILNKTIYDNIKRIGSNKNLTLALMDYEPGNLRLSGQHEELLIVRAADGSLEQIDTMALGFPIGLTEDISEFVAQVELKLAQNDVVVMYTDGITEAENMEHEQYGLERLCAVVQAHYKDSAHSIKRAVIEDLMAYIGNQTIYDDITLLVL
jgi:serine phosphatase RsbU (regulator of sigma subunit)